MVRTTVAKPSHTYTIAIKLPILETFVLRNERGNFCFVSRSGLKRYVYVVVVAVLEQAEVKRPGHFGGYGVFPEYM